MIDEALRRTAEPALRAYVVWLPILPDDDQAAAATAAERFVEPRVSHYWDPERALGAALGETLALPPREQGSSHGVAWDVYLLYARGARWGEAPAFWMHQLDGVPVALAPRLEASALRIRMDTLGGPRR